MASILTLNLVKNQGNVTSTTVTMQTHDAVLARQFCMQICKSGGVFDDNNVWVPASAISSISIS